MSRHSASRPPRSGESPPASGGEEEPAKRGEPALVRGDRAGVIEWANREWSRLVGLPLEVTLEKPIGSLLERYAIEPAAVDCVSRQFLAGETCELELPFTPPAGEQRWLHVRVEPLRDEAGEVIKFLATASDITDRKRREPPAPVCECDLSELARECAAALTPELGERTAFDAALAEDLRPAYLDTSRVGALVRHLIRRGARAIGDEWGMISLTTGMVGLGEAPLYSGDPAEGLPLKPYLFLEVHDSGRATAGEARRRISDPFLPARYPARGASFPNALALVREFGGEIKFEHDQSWGTAIVVIFPAWR